MNSTARDLMDYINNNEQASLLNQQIQELEEDEKHLEHCIELFGDRAIEEFSTDLHTTRIKKLGLERKLLKLELAINEFEISRELAE